MARDANSGQRETAEALHRALVSGQTRGVVAAVARAGLRAAAVGYAAGTRGRNAFFERGWKEVRPLGRPTVSVGNVTTGGTGKTPVVAWLATRLRNAGEKPAVLTRGYRATASGSDEARLLADVLGPDVPIEVDPDRVAGAAAVLARAPQTTCFLLDDGFQHRRAARDFDLVLIDATCPFGYGRTLPAGMLREPLSGLRRASAVLITRADRAGDLDVIERTIRRHAPAVPVFRVANRLAGVVDALGRPVVVGRHDTLAACAGIGNPAAFFADAAELTDVPVHSRAFGDHHAYTALDVADLFAWAAAAQATAVLTTEKDWVKLREVPGVNDGPVPVWRVGQTLDFQDGHEAALLVLIRARLTVNAYART